MKVEDPLIIWLRGEAGCAPSEFFFDNAGPYNYKKSGEDDIADELKKNGLAWNIFANVLVIDLPIGMGYSFPEHDYREQRARSRGQMINDFVHFMKQFYMIHPMYKGRELYLGGIDFAAGLYIPFLARAMKDL